MHFFSRKNGNLQYAFFPEKPNNIASIARLKPDIIASIGPAKTQLYSFYAPAPAQR